MKLILSLILALICLPASAQNKISPTGHFQLERFRKEHVAVSRSGIPDSIPTITAIVRLNSGHTPAVLTDNGYNVTADLGDIALVRAAITEFEKIAAMPQVKSISFGKKQRMLMKSARTASQVTEAHAGINISGTATSYTGKGVVLGLMDGGLDPNHINFSGRVDRLWHLTYNTYTNNVGSTEYNASTVGGFTTDDEEETHATHVAGIMAGGYKGSGTYMNGSTKTTGAIPHYGVAPDATLALSCGELYDPAILQGVSNIIDYAEAIGQPAAINLSLGSNSGPHDGTDDFSTALDRLGERALICVAAGNEGENNMSIEKTFTSSATSVKTLLYYNNAYFEGNYGYLDIWASDSQPLTVSISNCSSSGALTYTTTISSATNKMEITEGVSYGGEVYVYAGVDPNNGRYNVLFDFNVARPSSGRFAITVTGKAGQTVNMYFDGYSEFTNSYNNNTTTLSGYTAGTPDGSISGMACGKNVLPVGAYTTTTSWYNLSGSRASNDQTTGAVATFPSYGTDFFGRQLPLVLAPGSSIQSSFSRHYIDGGYGSDYGETPSTMVATAKNGTATDYWGPMDGTSMATPFMTGVLGLWLQAEPTLTMNDVLDVLQNTSTTDTHTSAAPARSGYGKVNATKGLKYILAKASIGNVQADADERLIVTATAGGYELYMAGATDITATLYDLQGRPVASARGTDGTATVSASSLQSGIYILRVVTPTASLSRKVTKN